MIDWVDVDQNWEKILRYLYPSVLALSRSSIKNLGKARPRLFNSVNSMAVANPQRRQQQDLV